MTMGAAEQIVGVLPMLVVSAGAIKVIKVVSKRNGKAVGITHYHLKSKKAVSHRHEGGNISHYHRGLRGYGRTRKALRR